MEGQWKFLGEGGVLKANILEAKYEAKLEFSRSGGGGGGCKTKTFHGGEWILSGTPQSRKNAFERIRISKMFRES